MLLHITVLKVFGAQKKVDVLFVKQWNCPSFDIWMDACNDEIPNFEMQDDYSIIFGTIHMNKIVCVLQLHQRLQNGSLNRLLLSLLALRIDYLVPCNILIKMTIISYLWGIGLVPTKGQVSLIDWLLVIPPPCILMRNAYKIYKRQ